MNNVLVAGTACLFLSSAAVAQNPISPIVTPALAIAAPDTTNAVLRTGTEVALALAEPLSTKHKAMRVGQRFLSPVSTNGTDLRL